jgi:hypothetical protein
MADIPKPPPAPKTNFDLLLERLLANSLASALLNAYIRPGATIRIDAMRRVLDARLADLRAAYDEHPSQ